MPIINGINQKLQQLALKTEREMKLLEVRRKTGALNSSISFKYRNGVFAFKALYYGKFIDEGTYKNKRPTRVSRTVWQPYKARGRAGTQQKGIKPLHFTDPISKVDNKVIIGMIKPLITIAMIAELKKNLK